VDEDSGICENGHQAMMVQSVRLVCVFMRLQVVYEILGGERQVRGRTGARHGGGRSRGVRAAQAALNRNLFLRPVKPGSFKLVAAP